MFAETDGRFKETDRKIRETDTQKKAKRISLTLSN